MAPLWWTSLGAASNQSIAEEQSSPLHIVRMTSNGHRKDVPVRG